MAGLSARKEKILKSLIEDYIDSASPVSSAEIQSKHLPELSSATIRNELAALEEMGYLYQPHTSAGRVPTAQAYEEYVTRMMPRKKLGREDVRRIKKHFNTQMLTMKEVLQSTARVISEVTNYTSLACVSDITAATIMNIKIVRLTPTTALVIVVTDLGVLKDAIVNLDVEVNDAYCDAVSRLAMQTFGNRTIREVMKPNQLISHTVRGFRKFFDAILGILQQYNAGVGIEDVVLEGTSKILEYPEYRDIAKAKAMLQTLDAKRDLMTVLQKGGDDSVHLRIDIGSEGEPLGDCAIVTVDYMVDGRSVGKAGVIGPLRMDYSKVVSVLDYIAKTVSVQALQDGHEEREE